MINRLSLNKTNRWVIKIGSSLLTNNGKGLNKEAINVWVKEIAYLRKQGIKVILVSSGAIAEGIKRLNWNTRPTELSELQAAAAVGQMGLLEAYENAFKSHSIHTAQILFTHDDLSNRARYLNASNTINTLLRHDVIPIINENDTVVTDEICFGDNDTLGALTVNLINADVLVILTDQQGLYDSNPNVNPNAKLILEAKVSQKEIEDMASPEGGNLGRGGMYTKVMAAKLAARSGAATIIASGEEKNILQRLFKGEKIGTILIPDIEPTNARKKWLAGHLKAKGTLLLDEGAIKALKQDNKSLLPIGVISCKGTFEQGDLIICVNTQGTEIARGLINYPSHETKKIIGKPLKDISNILNSKIDKPLIHKDNLLISNE